MWAEGITEKQYWEEAEKEKEEKTEEIKKKAPNSHVRFVESM